MKSGIYWIVGPTGKAYIGSSQNVARRLAQHRRALQRGYHDNAHLQRAANKHGLESFLFAAIEYCEIDKLIEREQFHIDTQGFDTLYNGRPKAESQRGFKHTPQAREANRVRMTTYMADPANRVAFKTRTTLALNAPEVRAANSLRAKAIAANDTLRGERMRRMKQAADTPEARNRQRESITAYAQSPEGRAARSAAAKRRWAIAKAT